MKKIFRSILSILLTAISIDSFSQAESDIVITEIMYNQIGDDSLEYIELYNKGSIALNLTGYKFTSGITYTFPNITLQANSYLVLSKYPSFLNTFFEINSIGWTEGSLDNNGEKIVLKTPAGIIADSVEYEDGGPWPKDANGKGPSLVLCDATKNNALGYNWKASDEFQGTFPSGTSNIIFGSAGTGSSCEASADIFPPRIRKAYAESAQKVTIKYDEPVQLIASQNLGNYSGLGTVASIVQSSSMDSVTLILETPLTTGRFYTLSVSNIADTAGNIITAPKTESIVFNNTRAALVITEIFYDNAGTDTLEFIEILNNGIEPAIVGGYEFTDGVDFTFPSMTIAPGAYVLVAQYPGAFNSFFGTSTTLQFVGSLSNAGEKLTIKNTVKDIIDSVTYSNSWLSIPLGASLVLCDASSDNGLKGSWGASKESKGNFLGSPVWASPGKVETNCSAVAVYKRVDSENNLAVYPNPSNGTFEVFTTFTGDNRTDIFNSLGQIVYSMQSPEQKSTINLNSELQKGLHYVRVTDLVRNTYSITKIVIE